MEKNYGTEFSINFFLLTTSSKNGSVFAYSSHFWSGAEEGGSVVYHSLSCVSLSLAIQRGNAVNVVYNLFMHI